MANKKYQLENLKFIRCEKNVMCAAVSIILDENDDILLIKRSERENDPWSGHIGFPGGRVEQGDDRNPFLTAIRETSEEIGIELNETHFIEKLTPLTPERDFKGYQLELWPFLFFKRVGDSFELDFNEVQKVIRLPKERLINDFSLRDCTFNVLDGRQLTLPSLTVEGENIWGLTLIILTELRELFLMEAT